MDHDIYMQPTRLLKPMDNTFEVTINCALIKAEVAAMQDGVWRLTENDQSPQSDGVYSDGHAERCNYEY